MKNQLNEQEFYNLLSKAVKAAGSQKAYAAKVGVSTSYLNDVLKMRRDPGPKITFDLGYLAQRVYVPWNPILNVNSPLAKVKVK